MKLASCVILYNPVNDVVHNIHTWLAEAEVVYIFDNTENNNTALAEALKAVSKVQYFHDGENKGISIRLNQALAIAQQHGYDWLLTMDQDSYFPENTFYNYVHCVSTFEGIGNVAMFGPQYTESISSRGCSYKTVKHLITSGALINLALANNIGPFNEDYFIDYVDVEYCYRAIAKGMQVIQFTHIYLQHNLGEKKEYRSFLTFKKTARTFHSSIRLYYMLRNFKYLQRHYGIAFSTDIAVLKTALFTSIKNSLLYSSNKVKTLKAVYKAGKDYRNNVTGKLKQGL